MHAAAGQQQKETEGGSGAKPDGHGLPVLDPYLGSLLPVLDPKRGRVWLEKNVYVWRRRGRHGAESHSETTVHRKRRRRCRSVPGNKQAEGGGMCLRAIVPFLLLPVTSASLSLAADP